MFLTAATIRSIIADVTFLLFLIFKASVFKNAIADIIIINIVPKISNIKTNFKKLLEVFLLFVYI